MSPQRPRQKYSRPVSSCSRLIEQVTCLGALITLTPICTSLYTPSSAQAREFFPAGQVDSEGVEIKAADEDISSTTLLGVEGDGLGYSMAVGDLDCDGRADLILGAPGTASRPGRVYVLPGNHVTLNPDLTQPEVLVKETLSLETATDFITLEDAEPGALFGAALAMSPPGDVSLNGDACPDLVVGAPYANVSLSGPTGTVLADAGKVSLFFQGQALFQGRARVQGQAQVQGQTLKTSPGSRSSISSVSADLHLLGSQSKSHLGAGFGRLMDLDRDRRQLPELLIVADRHGEGPGRAYLLAGTDTWTAPGGERLIDTAPNLLATVDGEQGLNGSGIALQTSSDDWTRVWFSSSAYRQFQGRAYQLDLSATELQGNTGVVSYALALDATVTLDGRYDPNGGEQLGLATHYFESDQALILGAPTWKEEGNAVGRLVWWNPESSVPSPVDTTQLPAGKGLPGEGFPYLGSSFAELEIQVDQPAWLLVGAPGRCGSGEGGAGSAYILPPASAASTADGSMSPVALSPADLWRGRTAGDCFGVALLSSDLNLDGLTDLVVSAPGHNGGHGAVYILWSVGAYYDRMGMDMRPFRVSATTPSPTMTSTTPPPMISFIRWETATTRTPAFTPAWKKRAVTIGMTTVMAATMKPSSPPTTWIKMGMDMASHWVARKR